MSLLPRWLGGSPKPIADYQADLTPFVVDGITFECWVTENGQAYQWRSKDGRCVVGHNPDGSWWARVDGKDIRSFYAVRNKLNGREVSALKRAMIGAAEVVTRMAGEAA